jgi:hypothetical protein
VIADGSIPFVLGIDVEPDNREDPPGAGVDVAGLRRTAAFVGGLRPRLEEATGRPVTFSWFVRMDPQVAQQGGRRDALLAAAPEVADAIEEAGDVIGLHTHAGRWDARRRAWVADHADAAWIDECVVTSFAAFRERFDRPCREHRFGDRFSSPAAFERLASVGAQVDLTAEPGQPGVRRAEHVRYGTGRIPSYAQVPRSAHRAVPGGSLWLLPLSSADPAPALAAGRRWARRLRYLGQPRHRTLLLDRAWPTPELFWELAEDQVARGVEHLAFVIRSDLVLRERWTGVTAILDALLRRPLARRLAFVSGEGAIRRLSG